MTIHTIGYQRLTPAALLYVAVALDATVVDCRARPFSRKPGFGKNQIRELLGARYEWKGEILGGDGARGLVLGGLPLPDGIDYLEREHAAGRRMLLLCLEEAPGECHRHASIAVPLAARGVEVLHIYREELVSARALQESLESPDADYPIRGTSPLAGFHG